MSNRSMYGLIVLVGIVIVIVALLAHQLGLSSSSGLGAKKAVLLVIGIVVALFGLWGVSTAKT